MSSAVITHSKPLKILFDKETSQKRRREMLLDWQQRRRDEILDKIRRMEAYDSGASDNESEPHLDFLEVMRSRKRTHDKIEEKDEPFEEDEVNSESVSAVCTQGSQDTPPAERNTVEVCVVNEPMEGVKKKRKRKKKKKQDVPESSVQLPPKRTAPTQVMLSEWLVEKPEDFEEKWAGVLCPVGKRTLLFATRKRTRAYNRKGEYLGQFQSALPSGNLDCYRGNRTKGVTMLDCIYSESSQVFYVLDLICWNSHSCVNCDLDYRQFFLMSKFAENLDLQECSRYNQIPLVLLPYFKGEDFTEVSISSIYPSFPEPVDGVLFYHRDGFYIPETNPLCLWSLLTQIESKFRVKLPIELLVRQRPSKNKGRRPRSRKSSGMET